MTAESKRPDALRIGRLPIHFFTSAVIWFACGVVAAPFLVSQIVDFFYQPPILALVHTFTLGWITALDHGRDVSLRSLAHAPSDRVSARGDVATRAVHHRYHRPGVAFRQRDLGRHLVFGGHPDRERRDVRGQHDSLPLFATRARRRRNRDVSFDMLFVRRGIDRVRAVARQDLQLPRRRCAYQSRESRPLRGHRMGDVDHLRGFVSHVAGVPAAEAPSASKRDVATVGARSRRDRAGHDVAAWLAGRDFLEHRRSR